MRTAQRYVALVALHHAILQVILPILVNNLIADTYACVPGRGIHKCEENPGYTET